MFLSALSDKFYMIINSKIAANMFISVARLHFCDNGMTIFIVGASYSFSGYLHLDTSTGTRDTGYCPFFSFWTATYVLGGGTWQFPLNEN